MRMGRSVNHVVPSGLDRAFRWQFCTGNGAVKYTPLCGYLEHVKLNIMAIRTSGNCKNHMKSTRLFYPLRTDQMMPPSIIAASFLRVSLDPCTPSVHISHNNRVKP
jgi:hypothetical protein